VAREEVSLAEASHINGLSTKALRERIYRGTLVARKLLEDELGRR
jgi:DNA-directed RNA polymerase specialized sigma24 family protein